MGYDFYDLEPFQGLIDYPKDYGLSKADIPEYRRIQKRARIIGFTFVRDIPTLICSVKDLRNKEKYKGFAEWHSGPWANKAWIGVDAGLVLYSSELRAVIQHELGHIIAGQKGAPRKWKMEDKRELQKEGCCSDMDRWTWHMHRALEQMVWRDEKWRMAWKT